jgi:hypothetical protein
MTLYQVKSVLLEFNLYWFHSERNLNFLEVGLTGIDLFISSKYKEQQGQFKLSIFFLREGVNVSCSIKLECDFHRC